MSSRHPIRSQEDALNIINETTPLHGAVPFVSQPAPSEGRVPGLVLECPLCQSDGPTYVHAVDVRISTRVAAFGSDIRPTIDMLAGCERGGHIFIVEVANRKGELNIGTRVPYSGEVLSAWHNGSFDNWVLSGLVHFNPAFSMEDVK